MSLRVQELVVKCILDGCSGLSGEALDDAIDYASRNKVLLHFLREASVRSFVREREEARYRRFVKSLQEVACALRDINYVFIKLRKPVVYVPSDIDVLVDRSCVSKAMVRLMRFGFRVEVEEPYCITLTRGNTIVDLYVQPTIGGVIYVRASELLERKEYTEFNGLMIPTLKTHAEALLTIAHAVYKERIYTLNDYITVKKWLSRKTLELAEKLECINAVREALTIHKLVEERRITLPYRIPFVRWIRLLEHKIRRDNLFRATLVYILRSLRDHRFGKLVLSKLVRETY